MLINVHSHVNVTGHVKVLEHVDVHRACSSTWRSTSTCWSLVDEAEHVDVSPMLVNARSFINEAKHVDEHSFINVHGRAHVNELSLVNVSEAR
jgi:hypothetical protein